MEEPIIETKRQIPFSDPIYRAALKHTQERTREKDKKKIFGRNALEADERTGRTLEYLRESNASLEAKLTETEDEKEIKRIRDVMQENATTEKKERAYRQKNIRGPFIKMVKELEVLLKIYPDEKRKTFARDEFNQMFSDPEQRTELEDHFGKDLSQLNAHSLALKIEDGSISDEVLLIAARRHAERIKSQERELEKLAEQARKEFKEAVQRHVAEGTLPISAAENLERIDHVVIRINDQLADLHDPDVGEMSTEKVLLIKNERLYWNDLQGLRKTFFHEFTHAVAGESVAIETTRFEDGYEFRILQQRKTGVALKRPAPHDSPNLWLNEAITEWLALRLAGQTEDREGTYKGSASYMDEREELDRLFAAGLREEDVVQAYFENFTADQPKEEKGQHYKKLLQSINEIEGPNGFARLRNKWILNALSEAMLYHDIAPRQEGGEGTLPPDWEEVNFTISVGRSEKAQVTRPFVYRAKAYTEGEKYVTVAEQWERTKDWLTDALMKYRGKASLKSDV